MAQSESNQPFLMTSTYDEILSLPPTTTSSIDDSQTSFFYDSTNFLLILYPIYLCAILFNALSLYLILTAAAYRQYLSNVLLAVMCIGSLINVHGQIYLVLQRWASDASADPLCSHSMYLRDAGSILIHLHIFILACERILAHLKKEPNYLNQPIVQRAHLFLILLSLMSIVLSFTVPIFVLKNASYDSPLGLCIPEDLGAYRNYFKWLHYGLGHSLVWISSFALSVFLIRQRTISYSTLIPMNRMAIVIGLASCLNLLISTLLDDMLGVGNERPVRTENVSVNLFRLMNFRDIVAIFHKSIIGIVFFLFRPEIRSWLADTRRKFQAEKKETVTPQMLEIRNELDDAYETDDGNIQFRTAT